MGDILTSQSGNIFTATHFSVGHKFWQHFKLRTMAPRVIESFQ